jgi:hypothetical protein
MRKVAGKHRQDLGPEQGLVPKCRIHQRQAGPAVARQIQHPPHILRGDKIGGLAQRLTGDTDQVIHGGQRVDLGAAKDQKMRIDAQDRMLLASGWVNLDGNLAAGTWQRR